MTSRARRYFPGLIVAALSLLIVSACGGGAPAPTQAPAKPAAEPTKAAAPATPAAQPTAAAQSAASKEPYKVASVLAMTGAFAGAGGPQQRAIATEIERLNAKGGIDGHPIQYISYDDQSKPEEAGLLIRKAAQQDKASVVLGPSNAAIIVPNKGVMQSAKIPSITLGAINVAKEETYVYSLIQPVEMAAEIYLDFCKKNGWTKIANIQPTDDLGNRAFNSINTLAPQKGLQVVAQERYGLQDKDVTAQLSKAKAANPDALISWATGDPAVLVYKNMRQLGMDIPFFPSAAAATSQFFNLVGEVPKEKLLYTIGGKLTNLDNLPSSDPVKTPGLEWRQMYTSKFNSPPQGVEASAWDAVTMATSALKAVGPDPEKIRAWVETAKMSGLQADYAMSPDNHNGVLKDSLLVLMGLGTKWQVAK